MNVYRVTFGRDEAGFVQARSELEARAIWAFYHATADGLSFEKLAILKDRELG